MEANSDNVAPFDHLNVYPTTSRAGRICSVWAANTPVRGVTGIGGSAVMLRAGGSRE